MANNDYLITYSNKKDTITIKENNIDTDKIPLSLVGHGVANYGADQNSNFLHLLENFASKGTDDEPEPQHPVIGQIWYKDLGNNKFELNVCSALNEAGEPTWSKMSQVITSTAGDDYDDGDLYYDSENKKLKVYDKTQGWISVGPTDIIHTEHKFASIQVDPGVVTKTYTGFDMSSVNDNIKETGGDKEGNGALSLVKMTILAKEFSVTGSGTLQPATAKCCAWVYKFVVRSVKSNESYNTVEIVGAPNYELIAQNPQDLDWRVNIQMIDTGNNPQIVVNFVFNTTTSNYITVGIDTEITRI